jgi:hypothetical protein
VQECHYAKVSTAHRAVTHFCLERHWSNCAISLLRRDDLLCHGLHGRRLTARKLRLSNVDGVLMVHQHHHCEVLVGVTRHRHLLHAVHAHHHERLHAFAWQVTPTESTVGASVRQRTDTFCQQQQSAKA